MTRRTSIATIAVVIAVAIGAAARARELPCPPGYAVDQDNTGGVPSRPGAAPAQGGVAGQDQQLLNSFGAAVQGAPSSAAGALGGTRYSFGLGGSRAAPNGDNFAVAQGGAGGSATNGPCGFAEYPPCKIPLGNACVLLTAGDVAAVSGESWTQQGSGPMRPLAGAPLINDCQYDGPSEDDDIEIRVHEGGRAQFDDTVFKLLGGLTKLSGVGDAAYESVLPGIAEVFVIQGGTFFNITLHVDSPNRGGWAVALGRKVADRIKTR